MATVTKLFQYIDLSISWLPREFALLAAGLVFIKFADALLGVIHRAWAILGRG